MRRAPVASGVANRGARLDQARAELDSRDWHGLVTTPGVNFAHLTGVALDRSERLVCLGLPADGEPWIVCPAFEAERLSAALPEIRLAAWEESEDPFARAAEWIALSAGARWAIEPSTWFHDATRLGTAAPDVQWVDGAPLFEALRRSKDAAELASLGCAIAAAWSVYDEVVASLLPGVTEREVVERISAASAARGHESWSLVQFGPSSALPHGEPSDRALEPGHAVLIDWGCWVDGYTSDLTRTFWWDGEGAGSGAGRAEFRVILDLVRAAQEAALETMAPGVACGTIDEAARRVIRAAGHAKRFTHRLGHGLGREIHEPPYLVAGSADPLRPGDVVTVEPGVYLPGRFGVRWEDDVRVTEDGIEVLSGRSPHTHS
ncbi:MAG TPA: Xaa-Pro peptidase family protein [Gemmatimonadota bacterium]|nr:Xaa-Pro peptidase family protein [Gemmatimonadota bacterium]